jgi:hypothetical protein
MRIVNAATVVCLLVALVLPASAATINLPEGVDIFIVLPGSTVNLQGQYALPADFFGPGSDPFDGVVAVQGVPLDPDPLCQGGSPLPGEILIRRDPIMLPDPPAVQEIQIEIVQMKLVSVSPITVTYHGGQNPEEWNLEIVPILPQPPVNPPDVRKINVVRNNPLGGDLTVEYTYDLIVRMIRETGPPVPPVETTPPPDQFGGQGPWGIPAIPDPAPPRGAASAETLVCPACKADDFYIGFDGVQPQPLALVGQLLNLQVVIACTGAVPADHTTWGKLKESYRE